MLDPRPLECGHYYHIYNRGNNRQDLFIEDRNYRYFLYLYARHVGPIADTYAYCLLRNHFHLLVRIKEDPSGSAPSRRFSNLFSAYAKALNKAYERTGALFQRPFGRIVVSSDAYLARLIVYIHRNPERHGLIADFRRWPYSSYKALQATRPTRLQREEVLEWFGGAAELAAMHEQEVADARVLALAPEDF